MIGIRSVLSVLEATPFNLTRRTAPTSRRTPALVALTVLVAGGADCCNCCCQATSAAIGSIEIVPPTATVSSGSLFQVEAIFRGPDGEIIPNCDCYDLTWTVTPDDGSLRKYRTDPERHTATFQQAKKVLTPTKTVTVKASLVGAGVEDESAITIVTQADGDWIEADGDRGGPLDYAVFTGNEDAGCFDDRVQAFAGIATLGGLTEAASCSKDGNVAVFAADWLAQYTSRGAGFNWTTSNDLIDNTAKLVLASPAAELKPKDPLKVGVKVWIPDNLGTPAVLNYIVRRDLRLATEIFRESRAGIEFEIIGDPRLFTLANPVLGNPCAQLLAAATNPFFPDFASGGPDPTKGEYLHVVYVHVGFPTWAGVHCPENATWNADVIIIDVTKYTPTTLAHEFGHALALNTPCIGHTKESTYEFPGFERNNLMWGKIDHDVAAFRNRLSVGQVFRTSIDESSWVNRATVTGGATLRASALPTGQSFTESCKTGPYNVVPYPREFCPVLNLDVPPSTEPEIPLNCP